MLHRGNILKGQDGTYIVDSLIDQGGLGAVYKANRVADRLRVAVKILHGGRFPLTDVAQERFRAEINRALTLKHPYFVEAYDQGTFENRDFLVMEYLAGGTVAKSISKNSYDNASAFRWCHQFLSGLSYLHRKGCIHRDLKPNNLLLTSTGNLKIADLGILRDLSASAYLTLSGDQMGSVLYISKHQRENLGHATEADDAHSAACCLYEILSRNRIHVYPEHLKRIVSREIPEYVCDLIMDCLAGAEAVEALQELGKIFQIDADNRGYIVGWAQNPVLQGIQPLNPDGCNLGLAKRRFAEQAPLQLHGDLFPPEARKGAPFRVEYLAENAILLYGDMPTDSQHLPNAHIVSVTETGISLLSSMKLPPIQLMQRDSQGRVVTVRSAQPGGEITVYSCTADPKSFRKISTYFVRERAFHAMALSVSPDMPLIAVGSWTDAPFIVNVDTGSFRQLQSQFKGNWNLGQTAFLENSLLLTSEGGELIAYRMDFEKDEDVVAHRWPFPSEITAFAASSSFIYAGHGNGLEAISTTTNQLLWSLPFPAAGIGEIRISPDGNTLATVCFARPSRVSLVHAGGICKAYLPDGGETDTVRNAKYIAWSPSGKTLAVSDSDGYLSVFKKYEHGIDSER